MFRLNDITPETNSITGPDLPLRLSTELLLATSPDKELLRLQGMVTMVDPGAGLTLRDASGSVLVRTAQPLEVAVGDLVEARGYPSMADFMPNLQAVGMQRLAQGVATPPERSGRGSSCGKTAFLYHRFLGQN